MSLTLTMPDSTEHVYPIARVVQDEERYAVQIVERYADNHAIPVGDGGRTPEPVGVEVYLDEGTMAATAAAVWELADRARQAEMITFPRGQADPAGAVASGAFQARPLSGFEIRPWRGSGVWVRLDLMLATGDYS